jgi:hypothetical protein
MAGYEWHYPSMYRKNKRRREVEEEEVEEVKREWLRKSINRKMNSPEGYIH